MFSVGNKNIRFNLSGKFITPMDMSGLINMQDTDGYLNAKTPLSININGSDKIHYHFGGLHVIEKDCIILRLVYKPLNDSDPNYVDNVTQVSFSIGTYNHNSRSVSSIIKLITSGNKSSLEFHVLKSVINDDGSSQLTPRVLTYYAEIPADGTTTEYWAENQGAALADRFDLDSSLPIFETLEVNKDTF